MIEYKIIDEQSDSVIASLTADAYGNIFAVYRNDEVRNLDNKAEAIAEFRKIQEERRRRHVEWLNAPNPDQDCLEEGEDAMCEELGIKC